jgi:MFS-type transporter involved in bile tolerance (Atg22 family)
MGIYSVLLSLGAIVGSLLAGWLASMFLVDGLIYGTLAMAVTALLLVQGTGLEKQRDSRM